MNRNVSLGLLVGLAGLCVAGCPLVQEERLLTVDVQTTLGDFTIVLDETAAPASSQRFRDLVEGDFYDGTIFHQVVAGEFVQGGRFDPNLIEQPVGIGLINESTNGRLNERGTVAFFFSDLTAESEPTTQFLINLSDNPEFNPTVVSPGFAVFGDIIAGLEIADQIGAVETNEEGGFQNVPVVDVIINDMTVQRVPTGEIVLTPEAQDYFDRVEQNLPNAVRNIVVELLGAFISIGF